MMLRLSEIHHYLWWNSQFENIDIFKIFLIRISIKKLKCLTVIRISMPPPPPPWLRTTFLAPLALNI